MEFLLMRILPILMLLSVTSILAPSQNKAARVPPFAIVIAVETPVVKAGSSVLVYGHLTNTSSKPLDASGCYCGPSGLDSYLAWEVRDEAGRLAARRVYPHAELATGSAIVDRIVEPGESLAGSQDIGLLFDMTRPGKYVIQASRRVSNEKNSDIVKSNKVTVTVIQ